MRILLPFLIAATGLVACTGSTEPDKTATPAATDAADPAKAAKAAPKEIPAPDDVATPPADAEKTSSGISYKVLTPGTGTEHPTKLSRVTVNYTGWTTDGKMFDSTIPRKRPANFGAGDMFPGWTDALAVMTQGEKARFWIPQEQAYNGAAGKPAGMLCMEVELVSFVSPPAAPEDNANPPADAQKTASGLAYKVLKPGTTEDHPSNRAKVIVNFTGWAPDGSIVDSTVARGRPQTLNLGPESMPGWVEALGLMTRGEKLRAWIPEKLVGDPALPKGTLTYDIELLTFDNPVPAPPDVAAPPADAKKTASGLAYKVLTKGTGKDHPTADAIVTVNYTGWTTDGKMFDSSTKRGKPAEFPLDHMIPGWMEGIPLMTSGAKARFWIPQDLAYKGSAGKPAGMLVFDVELVSWKTPPPPIPAPTDVAAPPADAQKTASGLAYKVLEKGTGTEHPKDVSRVKVDYTGWTTDGKMFDSSVQRGEPAMFPLNRVIGGWTEGLQLMVAGDKYRFWIPQDLAYKGQPGKPAGMLVFDVKLLEIMKDMPRPPIGPGGIPRPPGAPGAPGAPGVPPTAPPPQPQ